MDVAEIERRVQATRDLAHDDEAAQVVARKWWKFEEAA
jgi:hypothetical protein